MFGGGSGYYPYAIKNNAGTVIEHDWLRSAGQVYGSTKVLISGGHILTNVYGGNETTDVSGDSCVVIMTGGTIGVPRTDSAALSRPVTCCLFGGGKGDQRTRFNTWTNVNNTRVYVGGTARIFGSVFGGGEDGHVLQNTKVEIANGKIGTTGTSYLDGNVFGGGRGFSGLALTAGSIGGNVNVDITGGTMLGSIYGGGRLASVGIDFTPPTDPAYGQLVTGSEHGYITLNISGGTIGTTTEAGTKHPVGGNVFGGCMGHITLLNDSLNPLWPKTAVAKEAIVTISGGEIMNSVYGGSEYGIVRDSANVTVSGGTIRGNVFGGGYGSDEQTKTTIEVGQYGDHLYYTFTPMLWTGCVSGNTEVNIKGGTVMKNVYGGGEFASIGLIDFSSDKDGNFRNITHHTNATKEFAMSWPYKFIYNGANPDNLSKIGGKAKVTVSAGKIGNTDDANTGYVFGGCKGEPLEASVEGLLANARETEVNINYASTATALSDPNCITGAVYGGGENGHVYEDAAVNITGGLIGYSVYGGGKGIDKYKATLKNWRDNGATEIKDTLIYSITAGKVYGNTSVKMTNGHVMRNVYGGGYMASVGKGNYAGGADDYSSVSKFIYNGVDMGPMRGYGEAIEGNLWDRSNDNSIAFLESGKATIYITGGTVGTPMGTAEDEFSGLPTGNVIGGSKGEPAPNVFNVPVHQYNPTFHVGNINEAEVIIGDSVTPGEGPRIYASVYGGGQDGHMRRDSKVTIYGGEIGIEYTGDGSDVNTLQWTHRGNVYGSGSGIGRFVFDYDGNGTIDHSNPNEDGMSYLAGCVAHCSEVNILGGIIHRSVYGGGSVAGTGMPKFYGQNYEPYKKGDAQHGRGYQSQNTVTINGNVKIGQNGYGGNVYGACRGEQELMANPNSMFATSIWTDVNIVNCDTIFGSVYGGGELGSVTQSTNVQLTGGTIKKDAFGGGKGIKADVNPVEANIGGNTTVELNKNLKSTDKGCSVRRIFGCNDMNGTPKGHALVHVYATRHPNKGTIGDKYAKYTNFDEYTTSSYTGLTELASTLGVDVSKYKTTLDSSAIDSLKKIALENMREAISMKKYDVLAVYGGGNLAAYEPTDATSTDDAKKAIARTEVIIDGCELTSIKQVYGNGNAASTPASLLQIYGTYEIDELFGGGNGNDDYQLNDGKWYKNAGANVGYHNFHHYIKEGQTGYDAATHGKGTVEKPYIAFENADATQKEYREANYQYGTGVAQTDVYGGRIHLTYGGSNMLGNIRTLALSKYEHATDCPLIIDHTYSGSKEADMDAEAKTQLDCVDYMARFFGGSTKGDVNNNINVTITNGVFGQVFAGNDRTGHVIGSVTVNIKESGCKPIVIDELYAGGYEAGYSIYGYATGGTPRTKEMFETAYHAAIDTISTPQSSEKYDSIKNDALIKAGLYGFPKADPRINIISATKIGSVFGGGYQAITIGSPTINVNMESGQVMAKYAFGDSAKINNDLGRHTLTTTYTENNMSKSRNDEYVVIDSLPNGNALLGIGTIDTIYGGGNLASVVGDTHVEIGTGRWKSPETNLIEAIDRDSATITGNVYGGGKGLADNFACDKAMVGDADTGKGSTSVLIENGTVRGNVYGGGKIGRVEENTEVTIGKAGDATNEIVIEGNVFGAGQGVETHGYSGLTRGNSTVTIQGKTKVKGSVYGGGEKATVGRYNVVGGIPVSPLSGGLCTVTVRDSAEIGPDDMVMANTTTGMPDDAGHVFGAGQGVVPYADKEHKPWSMDDTNAKKYYGNDETYLKYIETLGLASNTEVTIGGNAFVKGSVYGGAENGFVQANTHVTIKDTCQIGNGYVQMADNGTYLPAKISVNRRYTAKEWTEGRLYATGDLAETVGEHYTSSLPECASWLYEAPFASHDKFANAEGDLDKYADDTSTMGGRYIASDGHTFYGNVFGGGSGYYPYAPGKWHKEAGSVGGNIVVDIKGGHILTNVYGGNEMTNVGKGLKADTVGKCTINMTGGTLGVPRTLGQIAAHPVTCYLFGAGKGDQRVLFNKETNIRDAEVNISGGRIYGSVFGGGEDGHVLADVKMNISGTAKIGTWGTSYVDGNVFGGGRGFGGDAFTAGNVGGCVKMNISGGTMLGSVFGGGRLASVGYGLYATNEEKDGETLYGAMQEDGYGDWYKNDKNVYVRDTISGFKRGYVDITITDGTIGNDLESKYYAFNIETNGKTVSEIDAARDATLAALKARDSINGTLFEAYDSTDAGTVRTYKYRLKHTRGGNVFAGGMGRLYGLNGETPLTRWFNMGNVKSTKLTITGGTIKSCVYGGGELGQVTGTHKDASVFERVVVTDEYGHNETPEKEVALKTSDTLTVVRITGGTIGTEVKDGEDHVKYTFGSVFGGGYGDATEKINYTAFDKESNSNKEFESNPKFSSGIIEGTTRVEMEGGHVFASVYGGGEVGNVHGSSNVTISGGEIGRELYVNGTDTTRFGGRTMGNVYGGGSGNRNIVRCGRIFGNAKVDISGTPTIYHNIYGGGAYGSVGVFEYDIQTDPVHHTKKVYGVHGLKELKDEEDKPIEHGTATITITGGTIGIDGRDNGMVYGSSRGDISGKMQRDDFAAWVGTTHVTVGTKDKGIAAPEPQIKGSVYGSGENGHTFADTHVTVNSGTIGIGDKNISGGASNGNRGNVYGGGCGTDTYSDNGVEKYNPLAGIVYGNTNVTINGGYIVRCVYGGGSMGSVGKFEVGKVDEVDDTVSVKKHGSKIVNGDEVIYNLGLSWPYQFNYKDSTGKATVNINGGHIGSNYDGGDVFGAARGEAGDRYVMAHLAYVKETEVNINYNETAKVTDLNDSTKGCITGSVHGSGENGYVYDDTHVTLNKGLIGHSLYGAGKGNGKYPVTVNKIVGEGKYTQQVYGLMAGRVLGNTYVTMNDGHVVRNVYGGGNLGSVGKGNYAGGTDDYYPAGYGELPDSVEGSLWTPSAGFNPALPITADNKPTTMADYFLSSGKTNVKVFGGTVGDLSDPTKKKNFLPYGNVFGGSAGEAAPNVPVSLRPRYHYCPAFFSGYTIM